MSFDSYFNDDDADRLPLTKYCQRFERRDPSLTICNLHYVPLGSRGARGLAAALDRDPNHLVVMFCDNCEIGDPGMEVLAESLMRQRSLRYVYLSYNTFGNRGAKALARLVEQSPKLEVLKMSYNAIGDSGAERLAQALTRKNRSLTLLDLEGNRIQTAGQLALAKAMKENTSLRSLNLQRNLNIHAKTHAPERRIVQEAFVQTLVQQNMTLHKLLLDAPIPAASPEMQPLTQRADSLLQEGGRIGEFSLCGQMEHYLTLNQLGRQSFGRPNVPPVPWTRVLSRAGRTPKTFKKSRKFFRKSDSSSAGNNDDDEGSSLAPSSQQQQFHRRDLLFTLLKTRPDLLSTFL